MRKSIKKILHFKFFTFQNVKILKYKNFLIDFLDELDNFKQKKITLQNVKFFYILKQQTYNDLSTLFLMERVSEI